MPRPVSPSVLLGLKLVLGVACAMPFEFGPPRLPMPGHEAWGNALLMQGMTDEAQDVLAFAESRTPGRLTLARARAAMATE